MQKYLRLLKYHPKATYYYKRPCQGHIKWGTRRKSIFQYCKLAPFLLHNAHLQVPEPERCITHNGQGFLVW